MRGVPLAAGLGGVSAVARDLAMRRVSSEGLQWASENLSEAEIERRAPARPEPPVGGALPLRRRSGGVRAEGDGDHGRAAAPAGKASKEVVAMRQ